MRGSSSRKVRIPGPPILTSGISGDLSNLTHDTITSPRQQQAAETSSSAAMGDSSSSEVSDGSPTSGISNLTPPDTVTSPRQQQRNTISRSVRNIATAMRNQAETEALRATYCGDLTVPADITEEQIEEMEVDQPLVQASIERLKERLSIKIRQSAELHARVATAKRLLRERLKREKTARLARLRIARGVMYRQEAAVRPDPQKDLTEEGVEPNP